MAFPGAPSALASYTRVSDKGPRQDGSSRLDRVQQGPLYLEVVMRGERNRVVGIDTAEEQHEGVLLDGDGAEEWHFVCRNRKESVRELLTKLILRLKRDERLVVVLEAPRAHGRVVFEVASDMGLTVYQASTVALNHFRACEGQPKKNDRWDGYLAARMVFMGTKGCRKVSDPQPEERVLSRLTRTRSGLQKRRGQLVNQLRSILLELAPIVLDREWAGPAVDSVALRKILRKWPAFEGIERARKETVKAIIRSCRYRRAKVDRMVEAVRELSEEVVVSATERAVMATEITLIFNQMDLLETSVAEIEKQLAELVEQQPICQKLLKVPGVGLITAAVLVGELLPVTRNTTEASSATYSGLTPLARRSGKTLDRAKLGRGSNKHVLNVMFLSSIKAISCSALDRAYYDKKRADYKGHPKPHTAATLALARQRHKVIYKIMVTDARYDKEQLIAAHLNRLRDQTAA